MSKRNWFILGIVIAGFIFMPLIYSLGVSPKAIDSETLVPIKQQYIAWHHDEPNNTTQITLASGKKLLLHDRFEVRPTLSGKQSLLFVSGKDFKVLDANQGMTWTLYRKSHQAWRRPSTLSADNKVCFLWLDYKEQLTAIDITTGKRQSLTKLPTQVTNIDEFDRILNPGPVWEEGVVHDLEKNRLLFLIQEVPNSFFWQKRSSQKSYQIVSVDLDSAKMSILSGPEKLKGEAYSWEVSLKRKQVYILVRRDSQDVLEVRDFEGQLQRNLPLPEKGAEDLQISPDERMLLLNKRGGGFVLIDMEYNQTIEGTDRGFYGAWSPNSQIIAYLRNWQLWFYNLANRKNTLIAHREPAVEKSQSGGPLYLLGPRWSGDNEMLAVCIGGGEYRKNSSRRIDAQILILDLKNRIATILPYMRDICWIPHPRPFREKSIGK